MGGVFEYRLFWYQKNYGLETDCRARAVPLPVRSSHSCLLFLAENNVRGTRHEESFVMISVLIGVHVNRSPPPAPLPLPPPLFVLSVSVSLSLSCFVFGLLWRSGRLCFLLCKSSFQSLLVLFGFVNYSFFSSLRLADKGFSP